MPLFEGHFRIGGGGAAVAAALYAEKKGGGEGREGVCTAGFAIAAAFCSAPLFILSTF